jgi:nucleotide sugar dehydrogenase
VALTALPLAGLAGLFVFGLFAGVSGVEVPADPFALPASPWPAALGMALVPVFFTYSGWNAAAYLGGEVWRLRSAEAAEMAKLAETTYRDLNIAFANELARFSDEWGLDVIEVIEAANSQPYSHIHRPGVGVGGHCLPHYPYLLQASTSGSDLVRMGRLLNEAMPGWVVRRIAKEGGPLQGKKVHLLGVAYRGGVKESSTSPVFPLHRLLEAEGAVVSASDPLYGSEEIEALGLRPGDWTEADILVLVTDHLEYRAIDWSLHQPRLFVDGRNVYRPEDLMKWGIPYLGVGR